MRVLALCWPRDATKTVLDARPVVWAKEGTMTQLSSEVPAASLCWADVMPASALMAWPNAYATIALQTQQSQLAWLASWQEAAMTAQREWWDGWIARFGGGVPLDA